MYAISLSLHKKHRQPLVVLDHHATEVKLKESYQVMMYGFLQHSVKLQFAGM